MHRYFSRIAFIGIRESCGGLGIQRTASRGTGYYDKNSIRKISDHIYQVWTVTIYNERGRADAYAMLLKQEKAPGNPAVLNQESILLELDCLQGKYRIVSINIYDEKDTLLFPYRKPMTDGMISFRIQLMKNLITRSARP